ncbi:MAG: HAD domain-containing protein [Saprospiraceae bacterium]
MLVFLDIDGVMVPAKSWESPKLLNDGFLEFSERAVHVLQNIISDEVTVILTTSHKSRFNVEEWKSIFNARGIYIKKLGKLDESLFGTSRKDEILNWFNLNVINEDFIIIDDDKSLNALPVTLKENLILTSSMVGLTEAHLDEIESRLKSQVHNT